MNFIYPYSVTIDTNACVLFWYDDETLGDRFLLMNNHLVVARSKEGIEPLLREQGIDVKWDEPSDINIDTLFSVLEDMAKKHTSDNQQNSLCLNGWNFFEDLMRTFDLEEEFSHFKNPLLDKVYEKLFWGNNLESMTPVGKSYSPIWNDKEIKALRSFMMKAKEAFAPRIVTGGLRTKESI